MDFGTVAVEGLLLGTSSSSAAASSLDPETKQRLYSSGIFKTDRSSVSDDDWRTSKLSKTEAMQRATVPLFRSNLNSSQEQQMLCFSSSPKSESTLPYFNYPSASAPCSNYSGLSFGSLSGANLQGGVGGGGSCRGGGAFTPSQWMELEQQALIYKYINANVPVPSNLLLPIKKAFESAGFSFYHGGGLLRPNSLGWGSLHLGFSGSSDPEPGRCRRTDGKKWRCSRDAVADQKYCERHINRGRHRSRKPVEGQSGHPLSGAATTTTTKECTTTYLPPVASPAAAAGCLPSAAAYTAAAAHQLQPGVLSLSADNNNINRFFISKENSSHDPKQQHPTATLSNNNTKSKENPFLMMNYDDSSSRGRFGSETSDTIMNFGNLGTLKELTDRETSSNPSIHRFMNTSISIPTASSELISTTASASNQDLNLGMASFDAKQTNWIPISWESSSLGGPLGEVLHNANSSSSSSSTECKISSGLNLMMDAWDNTSSPTAVLHKSTFESVSNSSAGSSPRAAGRNSEI